jgi:hypothetical protein
MPIWSWTRRTVSIVSMLIVLGACDSHGSPTAPDSPAIDQNLTEILETENFTFHSTSGDTVDADRQEAFHAWAVGQLGASPPRIDYFKYLDQDQMARLTGRRANGWADPEKFAVHSVFPWHAHETVHLYSALIGRPSDFFNEGIAVAMSVDPLAGRLEPTYSGGQSVHDWARSEGTRLPAIPSIVTTSDFRAVSEIVGYQTAGSFVAFLISDFGVDRLVLYFGEGRREDSRSRIEASFQSVFGLTLEQAEDRWRLFLGIAQPQSSPSGAG